MEKLRVFSAFAGYGTDNFALKQLGIDYELKGFSEIDKYAVQCFEQNHCHVVLDGQGRLNPKNFGDITKIKVEDLPDYDLFTGGFPCQAFSVAGKGLGELDPRGTLFWDIIRINEIKKPKYMLLENVKGLTTQKHQATFDKILSELNRIGYGVSWMVLNTKNYGVPQNRERVFFVCFRKGEAVNFNWPQEEELKLFIKDILEPEPVDSKYYLKPHQVAKLEEALIKKLGTKQISDSIRSGGKGSMDAKHNHDLITINPNGNQVPNIPEIGEANRLYDIEGVSPSIKASAINVKSVQWDQSGKGHNSQEDRAYNADGVMCTIPNANPSNKVNIFALRSFPRKGTKEVDGERFQNPEFREEGCSNSLTSVEKDNLVNQQGVFRRLTPKECFRLQGFLKDEVNLDGLSDTQKYKLCGNGQSVNVVKKILERMLKDYINI